MYSKILLSRMKGNPAVCNMEGPLEAVCVRQRKTDNYKISHLHVESKKRVSVEPKLIKTEVRFAVSRGERLGELESYSKGEHFYL